MEPDDGNTGRRAFLSKMGRVGVGVGLLGAGAAGLAHSERDELVWQIDPYKCTMCGRCATACVLPASAVRCVHNHEMCGYCDLCFGYLLPGHTERSEAAENQVCPAAAITRTFIEDVYYEYNIIDEACIGCAKCVKLCNHSGNGSLFLQVKQERCLNCNDCAIARECPAGAFRRVPASQGYILKHREDHGA
jgi:electron transport complex protein RnfB